MGYPLDGKRYIDKIRDDSLDCTTISIGYRILMAKYCHEHNKGMTELSIAEHFTILGEAFEMGSEHLADIMDAYHFAWDVVNELLTPNEKKEVKNDKNHVSGDKRA